MSAFVRQQKRFDCRGVSLTHAKDAMPAGKYPVVQNIRSYVEGTVQPREGLTVLAATGSLHSIIQMTDPTPFATTATKQYLGTGANLLSGPSGGPFGTIDTGYSGDPLSFERCTPPTSPQPWVYVADRSRMRKTNNNGLLFPIGIAPPVTSPVANLDALQINIIENFTGPFIPWVNVGTGAAAPAIINRVSTTIQFFAHDIDEYGHSQNNASIVPASMAGIDVGTLVTLKGIETVPVQQVTISVANTTIAAIIYDSGTSGLCTIQPAASLGTGQLEAPSLADYQARGAGFQADLRKIDPNPPAADAPTYYPEFNAEMYQRLYNHPAALPPQPGVAGTPTTRIRQIDFPVNCLLKLGATSELVRIIAVSLGKDGIQSFRCITAGTFHAGDAIVGVSAFRVYTANNYAGGDALTAGALSNVITPSSSDPTTTPPFATAGIRTGAGWPVHDLSIVNGRAVLPDDDLRLCVRFNHADEVQTVRVYFDIDSTTNDFTQNYYFFEWRASDIISAIQGANADPVASLQAARLTTVTNAQLNENVTGHVPNASADPTGQVAVSRQATVDEATSAQLALGNNQWIELRCKISDLIRVGTDPSRTLANVAASEVLVDIESVGSVPVTVSYDALWISGGYSPDVGEVNPPRVYSYRYRSSKTGAISNPSPTGRYSVNPRRQQVFVSAVASSDTQADLIDFFVMGGTLDRMTYAGTIPTAASPVFSDIYGDSALSGGETLSYNKYQPWPTQDIARTGTCNVSGSAIKWVSGDQFNTQWAPGSIILVNGQTYTLYAQPSSSTLLFINENAGTGTGVAFTLPGPTLMAQKFATWFGGAVQGATFYFSAGDVINPGFVHWTNGNDPETTSDKNMIEVTPASDPLQNGFIYDGTPFVASTKDVWALEASFNDAVNPFRPQITPCGKGFWTRWAFCMAPEGCYFLADDGIYLTSSGSIAQSITDEDLYPIFPHDGAPGVAINGYQPPDMSQSTSLRLSYVDGMIYFDYIDINGARRTLVYEPRSKAWWPDSYPDGVTTRWAPKGAPLSSSLVGEGTNLCAVGGFQDLGQPISCHLQWVENQGDARAQKLYRDAMLEGDLTGSAVTVTLGFTNNGTTLAPVIIGGLSGRQAYLVNTTTKVGNYGTNMTVDLTWTAAAVSIPLFDVWDFGYQPEPELATSWLSGPTTHGFRSFQQVYMAIIAYRSFSTVDFSLIIDGVTFTYPGALPNSNGVYAKTALVLQSKKGYTFQYGAQAAAGCQIFDKDCEFWCQPWGMPGGYQQVRPF